MKLHLQINRQTVRLWLLSVAIGTGLTVFCFTAVQQALRLGVNEPQSELAEDTAYKLSHGSSPASVVPSTTIDESRSLAPFVTIVDRNNNVLASSGTIGSTVPLPPASSFPDSQKRGSNWFTWQHDDNRLRDATVIVPYSSGTTSGYVLAARSMKQVENTIRHIEVLAGLTLLGVFVAPILILLLI